ncbi:RNA polymerase sigma factor [Caldicellulosiruptor acetigenus]|uniref:RNA polymerase sigma factor n=1 Tax=Caldicellulosiruptor acetigenus TaxID=301953 RepID=UPI0009FDA29A|nr:sigma-70 family RNA polymerase sigma factor [Caldicellulosiruptor acetigenus]
MYLDEKFLNFFNRYFDDAYRYVFFKVGNKWDTDDIVSEAFKRVYENFSNIKSSPKVYLFVTLQHVITDHYRRKKNFCLEDGCKDFYSYDLEEIFIEKEELNTLKKVLKTLNKEELELINLRFFSQLSFKEISTVLNKSEGALKMQCKRIIEKLRLHIKKYSEGGKI